MTSAMAILLACLADTGFAHDPSRTKVTWNGDVARLVAARCLRCHSPDGKGPMSLATYEDARPWAKAMREEVLARRMPKWHAAPGYGQFLNDPTLSPFEVALIVSWVDGGAPRGPEPPQLQVARAAGPAPRRPPRAHRQRCDVSRLPAGRLVALSVDLPEHDSAGLMVRFPDGRREILAWIRHFEREFQETYRLANPLALTAGARLIVESTGPCSVTLLME